MATEYISREAAIETVLEKPDMTPDEKVGIVARLNALHPADVRAVVRGEWLAYPILDDMCYQHYSCSVCKRVEAIPHGYDVKKELPFCHCGADMRTERRTEE